MEEENTGSMASRGGKEKKASIMDGGVVPSELTPLEFMLELLRDEHAALDDRKWAAYHAAAYCHPKLSTVDHYGDLTMRHEEARRKWTF